MDSQMAANFALRMSKKSRSNHKTQVRVIIVKKYH